VTKTKIKSLGIVDRGGSVTEAALVLEDDVQGVDDAWNEAWRVILEQANK
jgi:hypothetical protein